MSRSKWNAVDYAKNSSAQESWGRSLVEKLALQPEMHVLDIGCGDGKLTNLIAVQVPSGTVFGIDASPEMVFLAQQQFSGNNIRFACMPAEKLVLPIGFDRVFSNATLHWIEDHDAVMAQVSGILKRQGRIVYQLGGFGNVSTIMPAVDKVRADHFSPYFDGFQYPYHFPKPALYEDLCWKYDFELSRAELVPKTMAHTYSGFEGWFRTTWFPVIEQVPYGERKRFISLVCDEVFATNEIVDGKAQLPMVRLEVEAIKQGGGL